MTRVLQPTNAAPVAHIDETDALVEAWTRTVGKMEMFARRQGLPHSLRAGPHGPRGS
jgi:hypothetical protein